MNLTEFLEELSKTRNGWTDGNIIRKRRGTRDEQCPVTAVCLTLKNVLFKPWDFHRAAAILGMTRELAEKIANAADGSNTHRRLQSRLLKAVGLK